MLIEFHFLIVITSRNFLNFLNLGFKKSVVCSETIDEDDEEGDSDVFADEDEAVVDPEELEEAFDNFLDKF